MKEVTPVSTYAQGAMTRQLPCIIEVHLQQEGDGAPSMLLTATAMSTEQCLPQSSYEADLIEESRSERVERDDRYQANLANLGATLGEAVFDGPQSDASWLDGSWLVSSAALDASSGVLDDFFGIAAGAKLPHALASFKLENLSAPGIDSNRRDFEADPSLSL